jgi:hypothetical protein
VANAAQGDTYLPQMARGYVLSLFLNPITEYTSSVLLYSVSCPRGSVILVESVHYIPETDCQGEDFLKVRSIKKIR